MTDEDGVAVATTLGGALHQGNLFVFDPVLELRQDPQRPESLLFNPLQFTVGPDGFYYVIDRGNTRVAVFDAHGSYVRAFGRTGQGPGEFGSRIALQSIVGDVLSIWQFQAQRTSRFRTDGTYLETLSIPGGGLMSALDRDPTGVLVASRSNTKPDDDPGMASWRMEVLDAAAETVLAEVTTGSVLTMMTQQIETEAGPATMATSIPFAGEPAVLHVPGRGIVTTDGDKPELRWYDLDGSLVRKIIIDMPARPISEALRRQGSGRTELHGSEAAPDGGSQSVPFSEPRYPDTVGFWSWLFVDDAGYVWLEDVWSAHTRSDEDGWGFHIVDPEGRYLGLAALPTRRPQVRAGRLMAIVEDPQSGEMVPTVYSILPGDDGVVYPGSYGGDTRQR